jgi:hypothetical protein
MSDVMDRNLWHKIRYTPLRDVLRGRLTARLDLRRPLEGTVLPAEVKQLLHRVVKATRLWRLEQLEVMQELIAHFTDGIESGIPMDELLKKFGNEQQAAQLIRRAKRRNRPLAWQALRFSAWSVAALLVVYFGYATYFFSGRPSPRVNYVEIINKPVENIPVGDRGWTFYRRALIGTDVTNGQNRSLHSLTSLTTEKRQPELSEFVRTHQMQIAWIREGAAKSHFGWIIGANGSTNDPELWPGHTQNPVGETGEALSTAPIAPIAGLRYLAMMLRADAIVAGQSGDGQRLLQDFHAGLNLSRQIGEKSAPLILSLISIAIFEMSMEDIEHALREHPTLIEKEDWLALSRRLSAPKVAADLFTFEAERMSFDDMLQRGFTDDGSGSGRLTEEGVRVVSNFDDATAQRRWWEKAALPVAGLITPSRLKLKEQYTLELDAAESNLKLAIRDAGWDTAQQSWWTGFPIGLVLPSLSRSHTAAERSLGHRDGLITAIALELYRREHGSYPGDLKTLAPELLPQVPADRITGEPIKYRIVAGRPLLYSLGADRKDDEGRYALNPVQAGVWDIRPEDVPKGDWVLYPRGKI